MASRQHNEVLGQLDRLMGEGTLAGLPDAQLLKRYLIMNSTTGN